MSADARLERGGFSRDLPSRPHGKNNMSPSDDETEAQPPKKHKATGSSGDAAKKPKASAQKTLSLEAEKRKTLLLIKDDADVSMKVPVVK
jgi:hypothetical protein